VPATRACAPLRTRPAPASLEGHDTSTCVGPAPAIGRVTDPNEAPRATAAPLRCQAPRLIRHVSTDKENESRARIDLVCFLRDHNFDVDCWLAEGHLFNVYNRWPLKFVRPGTEMTEAKDQSRDAALTVRTGMLHGDEWRERVAANSTGCCCINIQCTCSIMQLPSSDRSCCSSSYFIGTWPSKLSKQGCWRISQTECARSVAVASNNLGR